MSDSKDSMIDKVNKMSMEELVGIHATTRHTSRIISLCGIFILLFALIIGNPIAYVICALLVFVLAHFSVGADRAILLIEDRIAKLMPDDK